MLEKLANIPLATRALIRHARVPGDTLVLRWEGDYLLYLTYQALKLLPGLALDRLTVLGPRNYPVCSRDSGFLTYENEWFSSGNMPDEDRHLRVPQPASWQRALKERDGASAGSSVMIYRATSPQPCSVLLQPTKRAAFAQKLRAGQDLTSFGREMDVALTALGEREKEVLVVVWRRRGADYAVRGLPLSRRRCIREPDTTWTQIKAKQPGYRPFDEEKEEPGMVQYTHVDEYVWRQT